MAKQESNEPRASAGAPRHYVVALAAVALATLLRWALVPVVHRQYPFFTYVAAVIVVAWYAGLWPGLFTLLLGVGLGCLLFVTPANLVLPEHSAEVMGAALTLGIGAIITGFSEVQRSTERRARASARRAEEREQQALAEMGRRQQAETALQLVEERQRLALEAARLGYWDWDTRSGRLTWSESLEPLLGLPPGFEGTYEAFAALIHPDDRERATGTIARSMAEGTGYELEMRIVCPDGAVRWVAVIGRPVRSESGAVTRVVGVSWDIDARKCAELALQESEARFRAMADTAPVMVWTSTPDKRREYVNKPWLEFTGRAIEQELGNGWAENVHPEDFAGCLNSYTTAFDRHERYSSEYRMRRHDGEFRWILDHGIPRAAPSGEFLGYIGSCLDITELKLSAEVRGQLAAIVESSYDAIIGKDLSGFITSWNAGAERLYGYAAEEVVGRPISLLLPPEIENDVDRIMARLARGERTANYETTRMTKEGRRLQIALTVSPIRDETGAVVGASTIARDITERKLLEAALQARNEQIQTQAEELEAQYEELQLQHEELAEQDRHRNEFLAMLAHELRNPLAPIVAAVEVLRLRGSSPEVLTTQGEVISRQARHLARLVDDLLDVSRITQGKVRLQKEPVDLMVVVEQAVQICNDLIEERGHELEVSLPEEALPLEADATRLVQILCNLLNNAAKYSDPGGRITVTVERQDGEAVMRVRDTGRGIPREVLPRIFDLFVQEDRGSDRALGGLGVGLTLVRSLTEQHGGSVEALSDGPDKGSEFVVRLPLLARLQEQAVQAARPPRPKRRPAGAPRAVLLVDDNRDAVDTLAELMRLWGHQVRVARSGPEALAAATEHRPEVALLDIGMPGMDGYELARRLRETGLKTVLVALTGYGSDDDRRRARAAGFDHHLTKPVDPDILQEVLDRAPA